MLLVAFDLESFKTLIGTSLMVIDHELDVSHGAKLLKAKHSFED